MSVANPAGPPRKTLRVGIHTPMHTMDPLQSEDSVSNMAVAQVYETLYWPPTAADAPAVPNLAAEPLAGDGSGRVWTAKLRPGVVFSDGSPLTAEAVVTSLRLVPHFKSGIEITAKGADTVEFRLAAPDPRFDLQLTLIHRAIVLRKAGALYGTGPYLPAPGATLQAMRLVRNPKHRVQVPIEEIVFAVYPPSADGRAESLIKAVEAGEVDFTNVLSRTDVGDLKGVRKLFLPSSSTASLFFNVERPELADATVRRCLAMAIDRRQLTELCYSNVLAFAATSLVPPAMGTYRDGMVHDGEKAKAMASSVKLPKRLRMLNVWAPRPYLPNPPAVAERIAQQLGALGVEVQVATATNSRDFFGRLERPDYDLVLGGWIAETSDPADFLDVHLHSSRVVEPGRSILSCNLGRYRSRETDEALRSYREERTPASLQAVFARQREDAPSVPIMYGPPAIAHAFRVRATEFSPTGAPRFAGFDVAA